MAWNLFTVELPAGGTLNLQSADEVEIYSTASERYREDYHLSKQNDLLLLGSLLQWQLIMYRAQVAMNPTPKLDRAGDPTGEFEAVSEKAMAAAQKMLMQATDQVQRIEKALGIDKVSRESGGQYTLPEYIRTLKRAAHERGIHISKRFKEHESFVNEMRWRIRLLRNGDEEDRAYHAVTADSIVDFAERRLSEIEDMDRKFAKEKGRMFVGKL